MKRTYTLTLFALICAAVLVIGPQSFAGQMLANPGFEDGGGSYSGWFTFGAGVQLSIPATDDIYRSGTAASKVYGEFTNCPIPQFDVGGYGQAFTPVVGNQYEFHGYSYVSSADTIPGNDTCTGNRLIAKIVFFNAPVGGSEIASNEVIVGDWSTPRDEWGQFKVTALAPPGALRVEALLLFLQPGCDGGSVFVDDLFFSGGPPPAADPNVLANPSFTSGVTGWTTFGNVFTENRAAYVRTPTGSVAMFGTFSPGNDTGMYQRFDTAPGEEWRLSAHALNTCGEDAIRGTNQNKAYAVIEFRDAGGLSLGGGTVLIADSVSALGTWTKFLVTATAPAGADSVDALIIFTQGPLLEGGKIFVDDVAFTKEVSSAIGDTPRAVGAELYQNVPNPFNPNTTISFNLTERETVELSIYDVSGRRVNTLYSGRLAAGPHSLTWDGTGAGGAKVASGVYLYVLRTSTGQLARRMVLLK